MSLSALSARCIICLGPDITLRCGLGSEHLPTNKLITCQHMLLVSVPLKRKVCSRYWLWTVHFGEQAHFISYLLFWRCVHLFHWDFGEWSVNSCVFYIVQHISTCVPHISEFLWSSLHVLSVCECPRALCAVFCWCCFFAGIRWLTLCREVYCNEISSGWVWGMGWGYNILYCNYLIGYMPLRFSSVVNFLQPCLVWWCIIRTRGIIQEARIVILLVIEISNSQNIMTV